MSGVANMTSSPDDSAETSAAMRPMVTPFPPSAFPSFAGRVGATDKQGTRPVHPLVHVCLCAVRIRFVQIIDSFDCGV